MKKFKKISVLIVLMMVFTCIVPVKAITKAQMPVRTDSYYTYLVSSGKNIIRISTNQTKKKITIEYCDAQMRVQERKTIAMELPVWGGFYEGTDVYYLVEGQQNLEDKKNVEVFRAIKYDKSWNRLASGSLMSNEIDSDEFSYTRNPFDLGALDLTEVNGHLILATSHQGFTDPEYKQGHTGLYLASFRESDMKATLIGYNLWHSFTQFVRYDGNYLYLLEQSEGSRMTSLTRYNQKYLERMDRPYTEDENRYFFEDGEDPESFPIVEYGGERTSAWAIPCHATVDGMELSPSTILTVGSTIDQSRYKEDVPYNIYVSVTPKASFNQEATTMHYLTANTDPNVSFINITMTKVNDDRYVVSWMESQNDENGYLNDSSRGTNLKYVIIDGNGNIIVNTQTLYGVSYDEKPIVVNGALLYHGMDDEKAQFVAYVNSENGTAKIYHYSLSGKNMLSRLSCHTLTVWEQSEEEPVTYAKSINGKDVTKIVIKKGFSFDNLYYQLDNLKKITVEKGAKYFDLSAFSRCKKLKTVVLPDSVKKITTSRYYMASSPTIVAPSGSYAIKWAKRNGFAYQEVKAKKSKKSPIKVTYKNYHKIKVSVPKVTSATQYQFILNKKTVQKSKGNTYNSKALKDGKTYAIKVCAYAHKKCLKTWTTSIIIMSKTTFSKGKKNILNWKKVKGATGYEIATSKYAKKGFKAKEVKGTSLKAAKKTYVKVRPYLKTKAKTIYGPWSRVLHL